MPTDRWTGKPLDRASQNLPRGNGRICERCGTEIIDRCPRCGAPQCCPKCCEEAELEYLEQPPKEACTDCRYYFN